MEGLFGIITFGRAAGVRTFYEISKHTSGRYGDHVIHLRKPRTEWAGNELTELGIKMVLNAAWSKDPHTHLALFHWYQENAFAAPLIIGGKPMAPGMSLFVLTDIEELHTHWLRRGVLLRCTLDLAFKEYMPFDGESVPLIPGMAGLG